LPLKNQLLDHGSYHLLYVTALRAKLYRLPGVSSKHNKIK